MAIQLLLSPKHILCLYDNLHKLLKNKKLKDHVAKSSHWYLERCLRSVGKFPMYVEAWTKEIREKGVEKKRQICSFCLFYFLWSYSECAPVMGTVLLAQTNSEVLREKQVKTVGFFYGHHEKEPEPQSIHTLGKLCSSCFYTNEWDKYWKIGSRKRWWRWPPEGKLNYFQEWFGVLFLGGKKKIWAKLVCVVCVCSYRGGFRGLIPSI